MQVSDYFDPIEAAYAIPGTLPGVPVVDTILGMDLGTEMPYGAVIGAPGAYRIGLAGTRTPKEWELDFMAWMVATRLGQVADGIWSTYDSFRTASGVPLSTYAGAVVGGHSRGGPLAALWAVDFVISPIQEEEMIEFDSGHLRPLALPFQPKKCRKVRVIFLSILRFADCVDCRGNDFKI